jgi:hypothetical protein
MADEQKPLPSNYPSVERALEIVDQGDDAMAWALYQAAAVLAVELRRLRSQLPQPDQTGGSDVSKPAG